MLRVLLVDSSGDFFPAIELALRGSGTSLELAENVAAAKVRLSTQGLHEFSLVILSAELSDGNWKELLPEGDLTALPETSVFLISNSIEGDERIAAFRKGIDGYINMPMNPVELEARLQSVLKRAKSFRKNSISLRRAGLVLDIPLMRVVYFIKDEKIDIELTSKEFRLLCFLMRHEGDVFSRNTLKKEIWGDSVHVLERTVDSHISGLRRKLGFAGKFVESIPSVGYRFWVGNQSEALNSDRNILSRV